VGALAGFDRVISFDMGGTSTDVSLLDGELGTTNEAEIAGLPVAVPVLDIHTVGAGGGSIARFDRAGALRVGPESAGADPGPIAYGKGESPTITDAHLVLGRLPAAGLLGGSFPLDAARARRGLERAKGPMRTVESFARGILDVANATMEKAIRVISIERGHDPRDYALIAFGGAGGLHACELAAALDIPRVVIPQLPGGLSALGILRADVIRDFSRTVRVVAGTGATEKATSRAFAHLERAARQAMHAEGFRAGNLSALRLFDLRYSGQAYELTIPAGKGFVAAFHRAHEQRYGYSDPARPVEIVNVRLRMVGGVSRPALPRLRRGENARAAVTGKQPAYISGAWRSIAIYNREKLRAGSRFSGPATVAEYSATTFLPPGWRGRVDDYGNLILQPAERTR